MRVILLAALAAAASCAPPANQNNAENAADNALSSANNALNEASNLLASVNETADGTDVAQTWEYSATADPMSDAKTELACVQSTNTVNLSWPYGETGARLCLRNSPQFGHDAYVSLNNDGQILCNSYESCRIRIRFDKASADTWSAIGPSDNSSDMVFIQDRANLERDLRAAKTTNIQIEFYQNGMQTFSFNTLGLKWGDTKSSKADEADDTETADAE